MSQDAIDRFLKRGREEQNANQRSWEERWALKTNRQKAEYLLDLTNVSTRFTEYDVRIMQAAQAYATLAVVDATEAVTK